MSRDMNFPYADDISYWKSSQVSPDSNIDKVVSMIEGEGGKIISRAFGSQSGKEAYLLEFVLGEDSFRIIWPVLPTKKDKDKNAARIQATRLMYHDVKHKIIMMKIKGARTAFFEYLCLPDGQSVSDITTPELSMILPDVISTQHRLMKADDFDIDAEVSDID